MHLIERYSLSTGIPIDNPFILNHFFPVNAEKYVCFDVSSKHEASNYSYWLEVKNLLLDIFHKNNFKTVQVGAKESQDLNCDIDLRNNLSTNQICDVIKNCEFFFGSDSLQTHVAAFYNKKIIAIYSNNYSSCIGPYWGDPENQKIINPNDEAERKPSFSVNENPKTINQIAPEYVANNFAKLLGEEDLKFKTIHIGQKHNQFCFDVIPSQKSNIVSEFINVRMDIHHDEENLFQIMQKNNVEITLSKPIGDEILSLKRIKIINYVSEELDVEFVNKIKKLGINFLLVCTSKEKINQQRFNLFEENIHYFNFKDLSEENKQKIKGVNLDSILIKSNKKIVCGDDEYDSYFEFNNKKNEDDFFVDLEWFYVYCI